MSEEIDVVATLKRVQNLERWAKLLTCQAELTDNEEIVDPPVELFAHTALKGMQLGACVGTSIGLIGTCLWRKSLRFGYSPMFHLGGLFLVGPAAYFGNIEYNKIDTEGIKQRAHQLRYHKEQRKVDQYSLIGMGSLASLGWLTRFGFFRGAHVGTALGVAVAFAENQGLLESVKDLINENKVKA